MKKMTYDTPNLEIIAFETEDVIVTSDEGIELPLVPIGPKH